MRGGEGGKADRLPAHFAVVELAEHHVVGGVQPCWRLRECPQLADHVLHGLEAQELLVLDGVPIVYMALELACGKEVSNMRNTSSMMEQRFVCNLESKVDLRSIVKILKHVACLAGKQLNDHQSQVRTSIQTSICITCQQIAEVGRP